jgi:beta-glucosidase
MTGKGRDPAEIILPDANPWGFEFVDSPDEADVNLLWLIPKSRSLFASDGSPLYLSLSKNNVDVEHVRELIEKKPTVLVINYSNPWVIDEVYSQDDPQVASVLATFGATAEALLDVVSGRFKSNRQVTVFNAPIRATGPSPEGRCTGVHGRSRLRPLSL